MDLNALSLALRVAALGSFSAAAREAEISHSSVSRAVAVLEDRLGIRLFQRTSRKLTVTAEGALYLQRVAPLVDALEDAKREARQDRTKPQGLLRLTASVAYGTKRIVPILPSLHTQAPEMEVELILSDTPLDLVAERIDLAVRLAPAPKGDLISSRLHATTYRVVASPAWVQAHWHDNAPDALANVDCLRTAIHGHRDVWRFRKTGALDVQEIAVRGKTLISNPLALLEAACAGLGPALLADWLVAEDVRAGRLVDLLPEYETTASNFGTAAWLLYPSRRNLPAKVRVTINHLRQMATDRKI